MYRLTNPQNPSPVTSQFQSNFQMRQALQPNMNPMAQNFPPTMTSQFSAIKPMDLTELESLKKKRHFEEQQKRLLALKQKGGEGPTSSQVENPLNDLFGKKGNSGGMAALLGSLGDISSKSKATSSKSYEGNLMVSVILLLRHP